MIACDPVMITQNQIISCSVPENDYPIWVAGSYAIEVLVSHNGHNWKSAIADNTEEPGTGTQWSNQGLCSRYAPFDDESDTTVESTELIEYQIKVTEKLINAVGFLNVIADSIQFIMTDDTEGEVYNQTYLFADYGADDIYDFFFGEYSTIDRAVDLDLPPYFGATLTIRIQPSTEAGKASLGIMVLAQQTLLGDLQWNYSVGIEDYSVITRDGFGKTTVNPRGYAETLGLPVKIDSSRVPYAKKIFANLRGRPILWIGSTARPETIVFGYYGKFGCVVPNLVNAKYQLDITGAV